MVSMSTLAVGRLLPRSPRIRRRVLWALVVAAALAGLGAGLATLPSRSPEAPKTASVAEPAPSTPAPSTPAPIRDRRVRLTAADRRAIAGLLARFVPAAIERRNPQAAWDLVTPALRHGQRRADWARGELPVFPYQTRARRYAGGWRMHWVDRDEVSFDLFLPPARGARYAVTYTMVVRRFGPRWLVDSAVPSATVAAAGGSPKVTGQGDFGPTMGTTDRRGRLGAAWLVVPLGLLGALVVALPVALGVVNWRRHRRALAAYRRGSLSAGVSTGHFRRTRA
jgi:hypothetical protein